MRNLYTLLLTLGLLLAFTGLQAQTKVVSGTITDQSSGEPLAYTGVLIKGTTIGTTSDPEGNFELEVPNDDAILIIRGIGYKTVEIPVAGKTTFTIQLEPDYVNLEEVVVTGYGTQTKRDLTSSIAKVKGEEVITQPVGSFDAMLQGRASGLLVSSPSGTPGAGINVSIRGNTSITASSAPLYVIDGIPIISESNSTLFTGGQSNNSLADINPNDIESIEVLKDASAAAIYGSRGANGVVLITTKRGREGKTAINLNFYTGVQQAMNVPEMMESSEFITLMNEAAANDGLAPDFYNDFIGDPNDPNLTNTDWYDVILQDAPVTSWDVSIRGGNDKTKYYIGGGYFKQDGIQIGADFERYSARMNLDHEVNKKLDIGANIAVSRTNSRRTINDNALYGVVINTLAMDPTQPVFEDDGSYSDPFNYFGWWALDNPLLIAREYRRFTNTNRVLGTAFANYEIIKGLNFRSSWSIDYNNLQDNSFVPSISRQAKDSDVSGEGEFGLFEETAWLSENTLTYDTEFGDHKISVLGGITMQESQRSTADILAQDFPSDNLSKLALAATATEGTTTGTSFGLLSYIGRVNYNFRDKYLVQFTMRADGSSRFGEDNRYGYFPSGSVAWRLTEEPFMQNVSFINDFKLRASYGVTGNQEGIGNFSSLGLWRQTAAYLGAGGSAPSNLANPALSWERTSQIDLGIDLAFFNGRIGLTADYFQKNTEDLLLLADVPGTTGFTSQTQNIGEIKNEGFELGLNTVNFTGDFQWRTNLNLTFIQNEIVRLVNDEEVQSNWSILKEGEALGTYFLIRYDGVDPETGDPIYFDANGDGNINLDDRIVSGQAAPTLFGGLTNTFTYKGIELSVFIQISQGGQVFNDSRFQYEHNGYNIAWILPNGNFSTRMRDRWQQPGDVTDIPRLSVDNQLENFSTQWLEDNSFIRGKTLTLAYNFPKSILSKVKLTSLRVYSQVQNFFTITDYLGWDPEVVSDVDNGTALPPRDFGALGQPRTFTFGVNVGF